ncbi:uncharacterized protein LOC110461577 [Mizuhopecten yessoensis]|uniref:uncharacterized protein LOC110461577 n=1 Tax=Mizuhopecten yessoensis TaxID=6573 RepID=UPI000B45DCE8|nr:uncharacterized protein LOC110461577 [Mizuhopecten yessoensis]
MAAKSTSLCKVQIAVRAKGQTTCIYHYGKQLQFYCKRCEDVICSKCLSTVHDAHSVCELGEIIIKRKRDIQKFIERSEKHDLRQIHENSTSTEHHLKENTNTFDKLAAKLKRQTDKLKEDLDSISTQTLSRYRQIEEDNAKLIETYKQDLEVYDKKLKQQLQECKTVLQQGTDMQIYDCEYDAECDVPSTVKPTLTAASFTPNEYPLTYLEQALGTTVTSGQGQTSCEQDLSEESSDTEGELDESYNVLSGKQLQSEQPPRTEVMEEFRSRCCITSVCPTKDGQVWTSYNNSWTLHLLNRTGRVTRKINHGNYIRDISVSPTTDALWTCHCYDNSVRQLSSGKLVRAFNTKYEPLCICVTSSNHVIVGMANSLSKFTTDGKIVLTAMARRERKPLVSRPHRIAECPVTLKIAVIDRANKYQKEEDEKKEGHIVVMDTDFNEHFRYHGEILGTCTSPTEHNVFNPMAVVFDRLGNLIIADQHNRRHLLLSVRGDIKVLHTDAYKPWAMCVDRDDVLWTVHYLDHVKLLRYSTEK